MQAKHKELKPFASMPIPSQVKKRRPIRRNKKNFNPSPTALGTSQSLTPTCCHCHNVGQNQPYFLKQKWQRVKKLVVKSIWIDKSKLEGLVRERPIWVKKKDNGPILIPGEHGDFNSRDYSSQSEDVISLENVRKIHEFVPRDYSNKPEVTKLARNHSGFIPREQTHQPKATVLHLF
ncbi:hypothetical protein Q3G72_032178 [Acer saccharum]|nr:hypothetical protein Q3G72_032178 [Acer saccharum]